MDAAVRTKVIAKSAVKIDEKMDGPFSASWPLFASTGDRQCRTWAVGGDKSAVPDLLILLTGDVVQYFYDKNQSRRLPGAQRGGGDAKDMRGHQTRIRNAEGEN